MNGNIVAPAQRRRFGRAAVNSDRVSECSRFASQSHKCDLIGDYQPHCYKKTEVTLRFSVHQLSEIRLFRAIWESLAPFHLGS